MRRSSRNHVNCSQLCAVLGIGLGIKSNLLTLVERSESLGLNCGEMYENVIAAVIVGDEAVALLCIEPLYCTCVHFGYLHKIFCTRSKPGGANRTRDLTKSVSISNTAISISRFSLKVKPFRKKNLFFKKKAPFVNKSCDFFHFLKNIFKNNFTFLFFYDII